jgi:hypothetical protein
MASSTTTTTTSTTTSTTTTAPFAIVDVRPNDGATGIALSTTIEIDFNKPIDTDTVTLVVALRAYKTYNNQTVASNEIIEGDTDFANGDLTVVFTPSGPLYEQADYDVVLDDGVTTADGSESIDTLFGWSFQTGIVPTIPDEVSEPQIAPPLEDYPEALEGLSVVSTYPAPYEAQVPIDLAPYGAIRIKFNKNVSQLSSNLAYEALNGDTALVTPDLDVNHTVAYPGSLVTFTPAASFPQNALVTLSLADVTATDTTVLQQYVLVFATVLSPAYTTVQQIRALLGPFADLITDVAIASLILEYSLEADILAINGFNNAALGALAKKKWVQCKVALDLLMANMLDSQGKSKRLADFEVAYTGVSPREKEAFYKKFQDCIDRWEEILRTGGRGVQPQMTIKGLNDPDRPEVGRLWTERPNAGPFVNTTVQKVVGRRGVRAARDPRFYYDKNRHVIYRTSRSWD